MRGRWNDEEDDEEGAAVEEEGWRPAAKRTRAFHALPLSHYYLSTFGRVCVAPVYPVSVMNDLLCSGGCSFEQCARERKRHGVKEVR